MQTLIKRLLLFTAVYGVFAECSREARSIINVPLKMPMGVALCGRRIFVAEGESNRVKIFGSSGEIIKEIGGFLQPVDIACAGTAVYVADFGADEIVKLDLDGRKQSSFGKPGSGKGRFKAPSGIAIQGGQIYISEFYGHRIQKLTLTGEPLGFVGKKGHGEGELYYPTDIHVCSRNYLHVADAYNHRLQIFKPDGSLSKVYSRTKYGFNVPSGIVWTKDRGYFIADSANHRVVAIGHDGTAKTVWQATKGKVFSPTRLDNGPESDLIIVDTASGRILRL